MDNTGINIIPYDKSPLGEIQAVPHGRISGEDARLLLYLSRMSDGNIVEIGCHRGGTTRMLAENNPDKLVFGVDWSGPPTMVEGQAQEHLAANEVGESARDLPNVRICDMISWDFEFHFDMGMVFVDGDHSHRGLLLDTANILKQLKSGIVVFHDYYEGAPEWCAVNSLVDEMLSRAYRVNHITGTNCAWIEI